eukprot:FR743891.1.p3 GENE.FR743891.1~~FR743891.1.p3  ORF type:complete len:101 (+),score=15.35 FR743891.1:374-676(+)
MSSTSRMAILIAIVNKHRFVVVPLFKKKKKKAAAVSDSQGPEPRGSTSSRAAATAVELQLLFPLVRVNCALGVIMVIAVSCVKLLSAHNSPQHTSRKHKV